MEPKTHFSAEHVGIQTAAWLEKSVKPLARKAGRLDEFMEAAQQYVGKVEDVATRASGGGMRSRAVVESSDEEDDAV